MGSAWARAVSVLVVGLVVVVGALAQVSPPRPQARLERLQEDLQRLEQESEQLRRREQGVLGRLDRLSGELRVQQARLDEVNARRELQNAAILDIESSLERLGQEQRTRRRYLAFRLREIYKGGPAQSLRRLSGGGSQDAYWDGWRYAAHLSDRDGKTLASFRQDEEAIETEDERLRAERAVLQESRDDLLRARKQLEAGRRRHKRQLTGLREDRDLRRSAIAELEQAAAELNRLVSGLPAETPGSARVDVSKFRGLLDWPAAGALGDAFGTVIHPRFKTRVPHPGLDIEGDFGSPIRAVFGGQVVFAEWMRGYGLTVIVDHGGGVLSVYAHASAVLVETGEELLRGAKLATVGDTGSLRGHYLYFELRVDGKPVDPLRWLRPRGSR